MNDTFRSFEGQKDGFRNQPNPTYVIHQSRSGDVINLPVAQKNMLKESGYLSDRNGSMATTSKYVMRLALLLMLFQFFAPAMVPYSATEVRNANDTHYHAQHAAVVAPLLLKEKDEKEHEELLLLPILAKLLDLSDHSFNLTATHKETKNYFHHNELFHLQPALYKRHCTLLI